jgi:hypothetical protein
MCACWCCAYHTDGMLLFCDTADEPVLAAVLEVQRSWDATKRWTGKLYVAQLEAELMVNAAVVVYCPGVLDEEPSSVERGRIVPVEPKT